MYRRYYLLANNIAGSASKKLAQIQRDIDGIGNDLILTPPGTPLPPLTPENQRKVNALNHHKANIEEYINERVDRIIRQMPEDTPQDVKDFIKASAISTMAGNEPAQETLPDYLRVDAFKPSISTLGIEFGASVEGPSAREQALFDKILEFEHGNNIFEPDPEPPNNGGATPKTENIPTFGASNVPLSGAIRSQFNSVAEQPGQTSMQAPEAEPGNLAEPLQPADPLPAEELPPDLSAPDLSEAAPPELVDLDAPEINTTPEQAAPQEAADQPPVVEDVAMPVPEQDVTPQDSPDLETSDISPVNESLPEPEAMPDAMPEVPEKTAAPEIFDTIPQDVTSAPPAENVQEAASQDIAPENTPVAETQEDVASPEIGAEMEQPQDMTATPDAPTVSEAETPEMNMQAVQAEPPDTADQAPTVEDVEVAAPEEEHAPEETAEPEGGDMPPTNDNLLEPAENDPDRPSEDWAQDLQQQYAAPEAGQPQQEAVKEQESLPEPAENDPDRPSEDWAQDLQQQYAQPEAEQPQQEAAKEQDNAPGQGAGQEMPDPAPDQDSDRPSADWAADLEAEYGGQGDDAPDMSDNSPANDNAPSQDVPDDDREYG